MFDRPILTEPVDGRSSSKKCTCFHRRPQSSPSATPPPSDAVIASPVRPNTDRHRSLMQTATLSAYHPTELARTPIKSCSLLNESDNRLDMYTDTYEFVDSTKKVSYLTGSARCTLVTTSAATLTPATNPTNHTTHSVIHSFTSRLRFGKLIHR